jgi:hypothetical protein
MNVYELEKEVESITKDKDVDICNVLIEIKKQLNVISSAAHQS